MHKCALIVCFWCLCQAVSIVGSSTARRSQGTLHDSLDTCSMASSSPKMKIMTWNVLYGGEGDHPGRLEGIQRWLREEQGFPPNATKSVLCLIISYSQTESVWFSCFSIGKPTADLVAFNECNGWQHEGVLQAIANACGYEYFEFLECKTRYNLAVMSKTPIRVIEKVVSVNSLSQQKEA
jgi:hypothetical protein